MPQPPPPGPSGMPTLQDMGSFIAQTVIQQFMQSGIMNQDAKIHEVVVRNPQGRKVKATATLPQLLCDLKESIDDLNDTIRSAEGGEGRGPREHNHRVKAS